MNIEIKAAKNTVLGGPDRVPYLKLELYEDGNAVLCASHCLVTQDLPSAEWSGGTRIWSASLSPGAYALADLAAIEALARQLRPLLERVDAGHWADWDGSIPFSRLTDDASEASVAIERLVQAERWWSDREVWDADDWLFELGYAGAAKDYDLHADSNEAAYRTAGMKIKADALDYGVVLVNVDAVLTRIRRALQAEAKEDA